MEANFLCPHCRTFLNVGNRIVISAKNKNNKHGIILFSIHLGNYDVIKHNSFDLEKNEVVKFYCPACNKILRESGVHENIYKILMQDEEDLEHEILFSGVYGEKCTYRIRDNIVESFGEDSGKYSDFSNLMSMK